MASLFIAFENQIMTFAGYNASRGRVREWVQAHGNPRDPKIDPVDWVERIPLSETLNYVQRVMENVVVYRARFEEIGVATVKSEQRITTHEVSAVPTASAAAPAP